MSSWLTHPAVDVAAQTAVLIADPAVAHRWNDPSVLTGYRIGGLAAHLARAVETIPLYIGADAPPSEATIVDAAGYYRAVLGDHDPIDSELHRAVRERGESRLEAGHEALVAEVRAAAAWLTECPASLDQPVSVLFGTAMRLGDYLDTRLIEMLVHGHDLATSVGLQAPDYPDEAWTIAAHVLSATTIARHGPRALALTLARPETTSIGAFSAPV